MPGLPHWDNSQAARNYYEPVFQNQFEVIITPPAAITQNAELLLEHVLKVDGLPEFLTKGETIQTYKFAQRAYSNAKPETTLTTLDIQFEVNLNEENNMYIYNTLRGWGDLIYDPLTGRQGLKKDYVGEIYIAMFNKAQDIFREWRFKPAFLKEALTPIKLDYNTQDIYRINAKFLCDSYKESRIGQIDI